MGLAESAASGDQLKALHDLRDFLAIKIEECESLRDLSSLSGRFESVLNKIAELDPQKAEGDGIDEIAQKRAARRAGSSSSSVRADRSV